MAAVFGRVGYLQLYRHSEYLSRAARQQRRTIQITPKRGTIYDRNMQPLAMSVAEGEEMVAAVEKAKVPNMVWFNYRRVPAISLAKQVVEEGRIGRPFHFRATYLQDWTIAEDVPQGGAALWRLALAATRKRQALVFPPVGRRPAGVRPSGAGSGGRLLRSHVGVRRCRPTYPTP